MTKEELLGEVLHSGSKRIEEEVEEEVERQRKASSTI